MKPLVSLLPCVLLIFGIVTGVDAHIIKLSDGSYVSFEEMLRDIGSVRLVFIGELHDNEGHHRAQLQVIQALHESGKPVAIGLEMFRKESQPFLDRWTEGKISEKDFLEVYNKNWSMWESYREIFEHARREKIPLIGLNISRAITKVVAQRGLSVLSFDRSGEHPGIRCDVDVRYQDYIRNVLEGHGEQIPEFRHFCEAQVLWDTIMADTLLDFAVKHPDHIIVVLAGSGHTWKYGIPEQVRRRLDIPLRVLQPEIAGRLTRENTSTQEADYLLIGLEAGPLH